MSYQVGDVVTAIVSWINPDGSVGSKSRPAVIVSLNNGLQIVTTTTTKDKTGKQKGQWIDENSVQYKEMGLDEPSFLHMDKKKLVALSPRYIKRKIGNYKNISLLLKQLELE